MYPSDADIDDVDNVLDVSFSLLNIANLRTTNDNFVFDIFFVFRITLALETYSNGKLNYRSNAKKRSVPEEQFAERKTLI